MNTTSSKPSLLFYAPILGWLVGPLTVVALGFAPELPIAVRALGLATMILITAFWAGQRLRRINRLLGLGEDRAKKRLAVLQQKFEKTAAELEEANRQLKRRVYDLHSLFEVSMSLSSMLNLEPLIQSYLRNLVGQLGSLSAALFLPANDLDGAFELAYERGVSRLENNPIRIPVGDPLIDYLKSQRQPWLVAELPGGIYEGKATQDLRALGAVLVGPLMQGQDLRGIIALGPKANGELFSPTEVEIFSLMGNFMAVSLTNARLYEEVEKNSITDSLTGLYNYRHLKRQLDIEISRAERYKQHLALILLDVDHFKNYNDKLGHLAGNRALQLVAKILKTSCRESDTVARYGGEEFCVILPGVDEEGARSFGERIRRNVELFPFEKRELQPDGKITISLGAAIYPRHALLAEELLICADTALYSAKRSGRNRVCLYIGKQNSAYESSVDLSK